MLRHAALGHRITSTSLLVDVAAIGKIRGIHAHARHVVGRHVRVLRHTGLASSLGGKVRLGWLVGRLHLVAVINTVFVALVGLGSVQACLH